MHAFRCYIFAARIACDSGPTCYIVIRQGAAVSRSGRKVLTEVTSSEAGVYECIADNSVGVPARRQVTINVLC